ncbi:Ni/Fe-hydrogenase, b-type cytochrome subunit [Rubeoparvulum massiliense]|uniref:Ni/Fe-hydrogenase, b-type cytochrome subunit n=1 Tax=Rubeoparvulum massiliense TaxID=1631346 RepID=UPI00065E8736|nr:Ni/Fe-hydrogenase, b-type cytochrome subunit [Rubeoparvulum massiliense]
MFKAEDVLGSQEHLSPRRRVKVDKRTGAVYVWELPVRVYHWVNAISIFILAFTGFYIGNPWWQAGSDEAYYSMLMGWMRYVHFFAAYTFVICFLVRSYWAIKGNIHSFPHIHKKEYWKNLFQMLKFYLFIDRKHEPHYGHNALAYTSYIVFVILGSIIMILSGFFMLAEPQLETSILGSLFGWLMTWGGSFVVRSLHHWVAWLFLIFAVIHIYMAFRQDWLDKDGTMSSIFSGYKVPQEHHDDHGKKH